MNAADVQRARIRAAADQALEAVVECVGAVSPEFMERTCDRMREELVAAVETGDPYGMLVLTAAALGLQRAMELIEQRTTGG